MLRVALVGVGVTLLVGCFTVPSTYTRQMNGKPRPESLIGDGKPIIVGKTRLDDALIAIARGTGGYEPPPKMVFGHTQGRRESADWRSWWIGTGTLGLRYNLRTGTRFWPFFFIADPSGEDRMLLLSISDGVVTGTQTVTSEDHGELDPLVQHPLRAIEFFPADVRARLAAAGVLPEDEGLRDADRARATRHGGAHPTTAATRVGDAIDDVR